MNSEIFNIYIEKLIHNLTELTKTNILQAAQLEYQIRVTNELNNKVQELERTLDKVKSKSKKSDSEF